MVVLEPTLITQETAPAEAALVSLEDYMAHYAAAHYEWVEGVLIKMSPISLRHEFLIAYLRRLLEVYFALRNIGIVVGDPFVMRLPKVDSVRRQPDLQIILGENVANLKETYMDGPADIVIEVVSIGSAANDYGVKFAEYEAGGVPEYWILDPIRHDTRFYRLNAEGVYLPQFADGDGSYRTPLLPGFVLHSAVLWQDELPNILQVVEAMKQMLGE